MLSLDNCQRGIMVVLVVIIVLLSGFIIFRERITANPVSEGGFNEELVDSDGRNPETNGSENQDQDRYIIIYITGGVKNPGIIRLPRESRLAYALEMAGGPVEDADLNRVNLAQRVKDEGMYHIPLEGEDMPENYSYSTLNNGDTVDINSADVETLKTLRGIGDTRARAVVEYREQNGPFESVEEIMNVAGIGEGIFAGIKDHICVR